MKHDDLKSQVAETIEKYKLLKGGGVVIVGVSGGPDSVALLSLLFWIKTHSELRTPNSELYIAHLNHKLRGKESDEDEAFVRSLAERFGIGIEVKCVDIKTLSSTGRQSVEEVARSERYSFFESVARKVGASAVAVGHTADDNAETILHRIIRGTGLFGLQGMRPKRALVGARCNVPLLIRPLIFSWREDIIKYLEQEGLPYRIDSSNLQADYFRNKIRLELLPLLGQNYNKNIKEALCRLSEIAQQNYDFLSVKLDDVLKDALIEQKSNACVFNATELAKQPQILRQLVIRECLARLGVPLKGIGYKNYAAISKLLEGGQPKADKTLQLSGKLTLRLEQGKLYIEKDVTHGQTSLSMPPSVVINFPGVTDLSSFGFHVTAETFENKEGFLDEFMRQKTEYEEVFDLEKIEGPLYVRSRKDGDRFHPLGSKGIKKLKDFFIDKKVPYLMRSRIPIVVMNDQPIWIVGMRIDDRVKLSNSTQKVLKIVFKKDSQ
jgi:tRNA(Ile)-lysidine synthase